MFDKSEIVIIDERLYHLGIKKGDLAQNIFIVGDPARAKRVAKEFDTVDREISNREYLTLTGKYKGIPVSVIGTGIGTDNVEIALVEAFIEHEFNFESKTRNNYCEPMTLIRLGTSGGVQSDINPGSQAIGSYALGLDNTGIYFEEPSKDPIIDRIEESAEKILNKSIPTSSRFKGKLSPYASKASIEVTNALESQALKQDIEYKVGITSSSPGFYGPSSRYIEGLINTFPDIKGSLSKIDIDGLKVLNMEMESSLFFHLCAQMGYRAGTICTVISGPTTSAAVIDYDKAIGDTISVGLNAMKELYESN